MFTRCPECLTVFHISAAELRAADGAVVCGECHASFDALSSLSETPPTDVSRPPPAAPETELEADALFEVDEIGARDEDDFLEELESLIGPEEPELEAGPALVPQPHPEPAPEPEPEPELEPEPEPATWSPAEPEARQEWEPEDELDEAIEEDWEDHAVGEPAPWGDDDTGDEPAEAFLVDDEQPVDAGDEPPEQAVDWGEAEHEPLDEPPVSADFGTPDETREDEAGLDERPAREPFVGDEPIDPEDLPEFAELKPRRRRWPLLLVVVLTLLILGGAWAHSQRGNLLRDPVGAAILGPVYATLGLEATARWQPGEFQALKWEAGADPAQPERLVVAVEFLNGADFAQPYPVLRVVLEDRFGRRVGSHDIEPAQYLEGYAKGRRLPAGARVRTTLEVPDPGARAEGFRIEFCLESGSQGLVCGAEAAR
nr:zinc-ribbon and DUF3426 domain-containing protein [Thioalkalivibrio sp. XN8]